MFDNITPQIKINEILIKYITDSNCSENEFVYHELKQKMSLFISLLVAVGLKNVQMQNHVYTQTKNMLKDAFTKRI